jgi:ribosomal protein S18 acetylase RimI-like enzyme
LDSINIRRANNKDCENIAALHYRCHSISFQAFADLRWTNKRDLEQYRGFWCGYLENQPANEITWIGNSNSHTIGTVTVKPTAQSSQAFHPKSIHGDNINRIACLRLMFVNPDHQGNGVGTSLMRQVIDYMSDNNYRLGTLITHRANLRARRFYERLGWQLDELFSSQVSEFFPEPAHMRNRARYILDLSQVGR